MGILDMETTQTRRRPHIIGHSLRAVMIGSMLCSGGLLSTQAMAQPAVSETDARMIAGAGEKAGELGRGELLVNALKREKLDPNSIRQAMQSIGKLFDFRLSRAGDRYVFKAQNGRKLLMLRYQRGPHVYEAIWDDANDEYTSKLVDKPAVQPEAPQPLPQEQKVDFRAQFNEDEDGEVDVEHVPMRGQPQPSEAIEHAAPTDPGLPEDDALAGKPSPDAEFEDHPGTDDIVGIPEPLEETDDLQESDSLKDLPEEDTRVAAPVIAQPQAKNLIVPEQAVVNEPFSGTVRAKKAPEPDNTTFTTIGYITLILGSVFLLLACLIYALPAFRARRRASGMGLKIRDIIRISSEQRLAFIECDGYTCLIVFNRDNASFVAPYPISEEAFIQQVKAKVYWHQMAGKPLSDRQLASLIQSLAHPKTSRTQTAQLTLNDDKEEAEDDDRKTPPSHAYGLPKHEDEYDESEDWDEDEDEDEYEDDEDEEYDEDDEDKRA